MQDVRAGSRLGFGPYGEGRIVDHYLRPLGEVQHCTSRSEDERVPPWTRQHSRVVVVLQHLGCSTPPAP